MDFCLVIAPETDCLVIVIETTLETVYVGWKGPRQSRRNHRYLLKPALWSPDPHRWDRRARRSKRESDLTASAATRLTLYRVTAINVTRKGRVGRAA